MVVSAHVDIGVFSCIGLAIRRKTSQNRVHTRLSCKQLRMRSRIRIFKVYNDQKSFFMCRMVLEWREREHGDVEELVRGELMAQQALRACGLYKFWCLGSLRDKPRLL